MTAVEGSLLFFDVVFYVSPPPFLFVLFLFCLLLVGP